MTDSQLELLIERIIERTLEKQDTCSCALHDIGISDEDHKEHHRILRKSLEDWSAVRRAFFIGVVTTLSGGILGLVWFAIKFSPKP